jgi:hypothetical protein
MFKFLAAVLASFLISVSHAATIVPVYWPFPVGEGQAIYLRVLLNRANEQQKDYQFVLMSNPGAGGTIAVRNVEKESETALLAHTSAFFIRPLAYKQNRYEFDNFAPMVVVGESPFVYYTKKTPSAVDGVAIGGVGSTTHVIATIMKEKNPKIQIIPYKGLVESISDVRNGTLAGAFNFVQMIEQYDDINIVGSTGSTRIKNYPMLKDIVDEDLAYLNAPLIVFASTGMPQPLYKKLQTILTNARDDNIMLHDMIKRDYAIVSKLTPEQYPQWYQKMISTYRKAMKNINLD